MHPDFCYYLKLFGKIRFLFKSVITRIFLPAPKMKDDRRLCEDRREYSYTAHIPERRSGKDRRIAKNGKEVQLLKLANELPNGKQQDLLHGK